MQLSEIMRICVRDNETRTLPALCVCEVVPPVRVGVSSLADLAGRQKSLISGKLAAERLMHRREKYKEHRGCLAERLSVCGAVCFRVM